MPLMKNSEYTVTVTGYTAEGAGVARVDGQVLFIPGALRGERVRALVVKASARLSYGKVLEVLEPSPERMEPECPYFPKCGGCDLWHMSRAEELRMKTERVRDALERVGGIENPTLRPILAQEQRGACRNKAIFPVAQQEGKIVSGFYRPRSHDVVAQEVCKIQSRRANLLRDQVCAWAQECNISAYEEQSGTGVLRNIFVRSGAWGDCLYLIAAKRPGALGKLTERVRAACPELRGIALCINPTRGNAVLGEHFEPIWGETDWQDTLCGNTFRIAPRAFYQVNREQAERLYEKALEYAALSPDSLALDLYCGAGTITLAMARQARRVIGVEVVPDAVENARENAKRNGVENAEFLCADAGQAAQTLAQRGITPEVIVVDPPRKGLSEEAIEAICAMKPERVVYVSCDPATLARDLRMLTERGYAFREATPVDLFPATRHVESVVLLSKANK